MTDQQHHPHIVVGGGISGVSAAHFAARAGVETLVLEATGRLGGCMQTYAFPSLQGFWVEAGSHSCFNSYGNLLQVMEETGILANATAKEKQSYYLWRGGKRASILSALHFGELIRSLPRLFARQKSECSVAEYYGRGFGGRNYRDLFGPAFRSVICQDADEFPADALFRKKPRRKDVLRSFTMPTGLADIPEGVGRQPKITVRQDSPVVRISEGSGYTVELADGTSLHCDTVTLAVPPDVAARLLRGCLDTAADLLADIGVAEIDTLVMAFDKTGLSVPEMAGLISVDGPFLSAVSRDFLRDPRYRGFAFHFPGGALSESARVQTACTALETSPDNAAAIAHTRNRLPSLRKGHAKVVDALDASLRGHRIGLTGNWFLGVSNEDCVTRSRSEHERLFGHA